MIEEVKAEMIRNYEMVTTPAFQIIDSAIELNGAKSNVLPAFAFNKTHGGSDEAGSKFIQYEGTSTAPLHGCHLVVHHTVKATLVNGPPKDSNARSTRSATKADLAVLNALNVTLAQLTLVAEE